MLPAEFAQLEFAQLNRPVERVFVTENEINGLAFPPCPGSIVIFGLGYGLDRLADIAWLERTQVWYWGDIDTHGLQFNRLYLPPPIADGSATLDICCASRSPPTRAFLLAACNISNRTPAS